MKTLDELKIEVKYVIEKEQVEFVQKTIERLEEGIKNALKRGASEYNFHPSSYSLPALVQQALADAGYVIHKNIYNEHYIKLE